MALDDARRAKRFWNVGIQTLHQKQAAVIGLVILVAMFLFSFWDPCCPLIRNRSILQTRYYQQRLCRCNLQYRIALFHQRRRSFCGAEQARFLLALARINPILNPVRLTILILKRKIFTELPSLMYLLNLSWQGQSFAW